MRILLLLVFLGSLMGFAPLESRAEFYGTLPTGLLVIEKKHPYYLFIPPDYSSEKDWPLLFLLGKPGEDPKELITSWLEWAKENQFLVVVPSIFPREGAVPVELEQWLLKVKKEVTERYRVHSSQILLAGFEAGAPYAAYLGIRFPEEFSAVALVGEARPGPLKKVIRLDSDPKKQISFYLAPDPQGKTFPEAEAWALQLEKKGYRVTFDPLKPDDDFSKLRERITQWFRQDLESRLAQRQGKSAKKGLFQEIRKNVFEM